MWGCSGDLLGNFVSRGSSRGFAGGLASKSALFLANHESCARSQLGIGSEDSSVCVLSGENLYSVRVSRHHFLLRAGRLLVERDQHYVMYNYRENYALFSTQVTLMWF
jgi:hypothetical protein